MGKISLPLFLGEIGPARSGSAVTQEIQELRKMLQEQKIMQFEETKRKMSAPVALLDYQGGVEELQQVEGKEECILLRTPSKQQQGLRRRLLTRSQSQVEDLACLQQIRDQEVVVTSNVLVVDKVAEKVDVEDTNNIDRRELKKSEDEMDGKDSKESEYLADSSPTSKEVIKEDLTAASLPQTQILSRSPVKKLVSRAPPDASPLHTKFEWITVDHDLDDEEKGESQGDEFLKEVENVFEDK